MGVSPTKTVPAGIGGAFGAEAPPSAAGVDPIITPPPAPPKKRGRPRKHPLPEPGPGGRLGGAAPAASPGAAAAAPKPAAGRPAGGGAHLGAFGCAAAGAARPPGSPFVSGTWVDLPAVQALVLQQAAAAGRPPGAVWREAQTVVLQCTLRSLVAALRRMPPPEPDTVRGVGQRGQGAPARQ